MEADIAAIRHSVEMIEWCCRVLVHSLVPFVGIYLFRLALWAKDRFGRKALVIALASCLGATAHAQLPGCTCEDWDACVMGELQAMPIDYTEIVCTGASVTLVTEHCSDPNGDPVTSRRIVIKWRIRTGDGNGPNDYEAKWVWLTDTTGERNGIGFLFWRALNQQGVQTWWYNFNFIPCNNTDCGGGFCKLCLIAKYLHSGDIPYWPAASSVDDMAKIAILKEAGPNPPPGPGACGTTLVDTNGDGIADTVEGVAPGLPGDVDGDGLPDNEDPDDDNDGLPDANDPDDDGDGVPDNQDPDHPDGPPDGDNDGIPDADDPDDDNDGTPDEDDPDDDNDGTPDTEDPDHPDGPRDTDNDGIPDSEDPDDDNDGTPDAEDPDHPDYEEPDEEFISCDGLNMVYVMRVVGLQVLGLDGALMEDVAGGWEDGGGVGVVLPWVSLSSIVDNEWGIETVTITPEGHVTWDGGSMDIAGWDEVAALIKLGISAVLILIFIYSAFCVVVGD